MLIASPPAFYILHYWLLPLGDAEWLLRLPAEIRGLYKRRRPKQTDLYKLLLDQLETFFAHYDKCFLQRHGHLRPEVRRTLKEFIQCGEIRFGLARLKCSIANPPQFGGCIKRCRCRNPHNSRAAPEGHR